MSKVDFKQEFKNLYNPPAREVVIVDVPTMNYLMLDGRGDPNTSQDYMNAISVLYSLSYTLKFMIKKGAEAADYAVMPLEGLWWVDDMSQFSQDNKDEWKWTAMIMQPAFVTREHVEKAIVQVGKKDNPLDVAKARFESFEEGLSAQIMHIGPYAAEGPTIEKVHKFIAESAYRLRGRHHEIYLSDPRRTAPEKLKTVIRQPFAVSGGGERA